MATEIAGKIFKIGCEIYRRVEEMYRNERNQMRLLEYSKQLSDFVARLNNGRIHIPTQFSNDLSKVYEVLCDCNKLCLSMDEKSIVKKVAFTAGNREKHMELEKELHQAVELLQGILLQAVLLNQKCDADEQKNANDVLLRNMDPNFGVYKGRSGENVVLKAVSKPIVTISPNRLTAEWYDKKKHSG